MDLTCESRTSINYMVTSYFLAYGLAGLFLFSLPDKWGRWKTMAVFGTIHVICQFTIVLVPVYSVRLAGFALMGFCQLKNNMCYVWLFELLESKHKSMAVGFLNAVDTITLTISTLYYLYWNKNWYYLCFTFTLIGTVSHLYMILFAPESPKWLLANNRKPEAISAFNRIGKLNFS